MLDAQPVAELDLHGCVRYEVERSVLRPAVRTLLKSTLTPLVADWAPDQADGGYLVKLR